MLCLITQRNMKNKATLFLLFLSLPIFSTQKVDSILLKRIINIEKNYSEKEMLESKLSDIKERIINEERLNEKTIESISKQLDAASYNLTLFGILFGLGAIGLGIYVTYIERKIVNIGEENKELLSKNQKIKTEVEDLNKLIQNDIYGLYLKIKREETINILERLTKIPRDITNVCSVLLSRELLQGDFIKIKMAYDKLKLSNVIDEGQEDSYMYYSNEYKLVFFQHFLNLVMKNDDLRKDMIDYITEGINNSFENDIIKSTNDFTSAIVDLGIHNFKPEINKYFEGLSSSEHKNYLEVYKVFFDILHSRKNKFEFFSLIQTTSTTRKAKTKYGELLVDTYSNDNPTESEKLILTEVAELMALENAAKEVQRTQIENDKKVQLENKAKQEESTKKNDEGEKNNPASIA